MQTQEDGLCAPLNSYSIIKSSVLWIWFRGMISLLDDETYWLGKQRGCLLTASSQIKTGKEVHQTSKFLRREMQTIIPHMM